MAAREASPARRSLGIAVIGGLPLATALTLYLVPAVYTYLAAARSPFAVREEPSGLQPGAASR